MNKSEGNTKAPKKFNIKEIWGANEDFLFEELQNTDEIQIVFPFELIGFTNSYLDVIFEYLFVSYFSEMLNPFVKFKNGEITPRDKYFEEFTITCTPYDKENLIKYLIRISSFYNDVPEDERYPFQETFEEYETNFSEHIFIFPELANKYWVNLIYGAYWEMAGYYGEEDEDQEEFFNEIYQKYPEHIYGFFKNAKSIEYDETIYFSTDNWIIPREVNLLKALEIYSGIRKDFDIEKADIVKYKSSYVILNSSAAVWFKESRELARSISCVETILCNKIPSCETLAGKARKEQLLDNEDYLCPKYDLLDSKAFNYYLSELGDILLIKYMDFKHVFFSQINLNFEEIKDLNSYLHPMYSKIQKLIDQSCSEKCNWNEINDEIFEEMCYDIIYCHSKFDSATIQKMGKSRSRDGGRDIVVKTKKTPTKESELFIFQCKFYGDSSSLSASKIQNAANVIMQYGAKGYGIFTSGVIDSTAFDMLDGFQRSMDIDTSFRWSTYELERFFNTHKMIKEKYFKEEQ